MRRRCRYFFPWIIVLSFSIAFSSWFKDEKSESLGRSDANARVILGENGIGVDRVCYCTDIELPRLTSQTVVNFSIHTTYVSSEDVSLSLSGPEVPCSTAAIQCSKNEPVSGSFRLLAMLHSSSLQAHEGGIVRTKTGAALKKAEKLEIDSYMSQRRKFRLSHGSNLSSGSSVGNGMISLMNGCVRVSGCRKLGIAKMSFPSRMKKCSGYTDQTVNNGTVCISEARGHNRMRCNLKQTSERDFYDYLWVSSLGPYYTFQHFVLDKLPELLVARELLSSIADPKFLTVLDRRSLEILEFLGFDKDFIVTPNPEKSSCARKLLINSPVPGKYGFPMSENFPRPPELFKFASNKFSRKYEKEIRRDLIVYLDRGKASLTSTLISNIEEVKYTLKQNNQKLKVVSIDAARLKVRDVVNVMQRARVIVGIHGGQMANIIFAQADKNTSIIEIAGRQTYWKSYYYNGMGSVFDYQIIPRLCRSKSSIIHPNDSDLKKGRCRSNLFVSIIDLNIALNKALEKVVE